MMPPYGAGSYPGYGQVPPQKKKEVEGEAEPERPDPTVAWRMRNLLDAGYDLQDALTLAPRRDVDLHRACDLLRLGCPVTTALDILL